MTEDDKLDRILARLDQHDQKFTDILTVLEAQGRLLDAHGRELDAIHLILRQQEGTLANINLALSNHMLMFDRILTRLEAVGHRIEDIENRITDRRQ